MRKIDTKILPHSEQALEMAACLIREGELVGFPTETVYGLGANALDSVAVNKIFQAKGRPQDNPLIVHISEGNDLFRYGVNVDEKARALAEAFWPGPLTLVVKSAACIAPEVTCGLDTVGIRCPENETAREMIRRAGVPIAAPSANRSGRPSPTKAQHVYEDMRGRIPLILDGGPCEVGVESTVISMVGECPMILRPGIIGRDEIESVIGRVALSPSIMEQLPDDSKVQSPGMKYRHYAPQSPLMIVTGKESDVISYINQKATESTGILCFDGEEQQYIKGHVVSLGDEHDAHSLSRNLFAALRAFDEMDVTEIFARNCRNDGEFLGVYNRLLKASGFYKIEL